MLTLNFRKKMIYKMISWKVYLDLWKFKHWSEELLPVGRSKSSWKNIKITVMVRYSKIFSSTVVWIFNRFKSIQLQILCFNRFLNGQISSLDQAASMKSIENRQIQKIVSTETVLIMWGSQIRCIHQKIRWVVAQNLKIYQQGAWSL